jgi:Zn-dependent protease with chaperone function
MRAACAALALLPLAAGPAPAATDIHFQHESYQEFQHQLEHREVHAVVLHAKQHVAHITLADGRHLTVVYPAGAQAQIGHEALVKGASFRVAVVKPKAAVHHKLRYIAGGALIVVILVVLVVLLIGRRRELEADAGSSQGGGASPAPPPAT